MILVKVLFTISVALMVIGGKGVTVPSGFVRVTWRISPGITSVAVIVTGDSFCLPSFLFSVYVKNPSSFLSSVNSTLTLDLFGITLSSLLPLTCPWKFVIVASTVETLPGFIGASSG